MENGYGRGPYGLVPSQVRILSSAKFKQKIYLKYNRQESNDKSFRDRRQNRKKDLLDK